MRFEIVPVLPDGGGDLVVTAENPVEVRGLIDHFKPFDTDSKDPQRLVEQLLQEADAIKSGGLIVRRPVHDSPYEGKSAWYEVTDMKQFHGDTATKDTGEIVHEMVRTWKADNRPKTIIRVPSIRGGSGGIVADLIQGFEAIGARVLNASGSHRDVREKLLGVLNQERALDSYEQSQYDVIIGVQRVSEGMDWRWASTVYCVGLPRAICTIVQLMGRAMRAKPSNYPAEYRNLAKIRFFVPCGTKKSLKALPSYHARSALLVCAFLAHSEAGNVWSVVKEIGHGLTTLLGTAIKSVDENDEEAYPYLDPKLRAEAALAIAMAMEALEDIEKPVTPDSVLNYLMMARQDISPSVVRQVLIETMVAEEDISVAEAISRLHHGVHRHLKPGTSLRAAIEAAFADVLEEFNHSTLKVSESHRHLSRHLHDLNAVKILDFANQLFDVRPLDRVWLAKVSYEHRSIHGAFPEAKTKGGPNWPQESWKEIDTAIAERRRGWPTVAEASLKEFCSGLAVLDTLGGALQQFRLSANLPDIYHPFVQQLAGAKIQLFRLDESDKHKAAKVVPVGNTIPLASLKLRQHETDVENGKNVSQVAWQELLNTWWRSLGHSVYYDRFRWTSMAMALDLLDRFAYWLTFRAQVTWKDGSRLAAFIGSYTLQPKDKENLAILLDKFMAVRQPDPAQLKLHTKRAHLSDLSATDRCYFGGAIKTPWHKKYAHPCVGDLYGLNGSKYPAIDGESSPLNPAPLLVPIALLSGHREDWLSRNIESLSDGPMTLPEQAFPLLQNGLYAPVTWVHGFFKDGHHRDVSYSGSLYDNCTFDPVRWDLLPSLATTHPLKIWISADNPFHVIHEVREHRFRPKQCWWDPKEGETSYRWPKGSKENHQ